MAPIICGADAWIDQPSGSKAAQAGNSPRSPDSSTLVARQPTTRGSGFGGSRVAGISVTRSEQPVDSPKQRTQHERRLTLEFWRSIGRGTLMLEYPVVSGEPDSQRRAVDALVILDGEFEERPWATAPDLAGRPVMIIQTKAHRTDGTLVGQAILSPILLRRQHVAIGPVESVVLTTGTAPALRELLQRHGVREAIVAAPDVKLSHATYPRVDQKSLDRLHNRLGGAMFLGIPLRDEASPELLVKLDALILPERSTQRPTFESHQSAKEIISGSHAIGVVSTRGPLGMGISGFALVAQHMLRRAGAADPRAIALVGRHDNAVSFALHAFPGLSAELAAGQA